MRLIVFSLIAAAALVSVQSDDPHSLTWPDAYSATGSIVLPYAEINEPFEAYIDVGAKVGRIDFYEGEHMVWVGLLCFKSFGSCFYS